MSRINDKYLIYASNHKQSDIFVILSICNCCRLTLVVFSRHIFTAAIIGSYVIPSLLSFFFSPLIFKNHFLLLIWSIQNDAWKLYSLLLNLFSLICFYKSDALKFSTLAFNLSLALLCDIALVLAVTSNQLAWLFSEMRFWIIRFDDLTIRCFCK